jgi:hypothetical protein
MRLPSGDTATALAFSSQALTSDPSLSERSRTRGPAVTTEVPSGVMGEDAQTGQPHESGFDR